jgi:predicted ATPase/class 3 adenylate cyclase
VVDQPKGKVTLLFTDVEGSTRLLGRLGPGRYAEALELHRRLLREAFWRHGGYEVDCEGDAFFVAFGSAGCAVAAAAEAQRALAAADWPDEGVINVRMGVHTGEPLLVPPRYVGLDVHTAARIMAAGHGGQVLLSEAARKQAGSVDTLELGSHRLKDLLQPLRLYQLRVDGLPTEFPALKTLANRPTNLPVQPNALIGRERELAEIGALLAAGETRLLTLTGPGGGGKTRLALHAAAELLDEFPDGVFVVFLAPLGDPGLVVASLAEALALREVPGERLVNTVASYLAGKRLLLVLDNFEHVIDASRTVAELLERCPGTRALVTSRAPLRLSAEQVFAVPPLDVPDLDELREPGAALRSSAVALFVERARAAHSSFQLGDENADTIVRICERVDGLPLAIELAAARMRALSEEELLDRLGQRLPVLTGGLRDAPARQQTLRATIEWSYDLLGEPEQALFTSLAVFAGGFTLEAAEEVCSADVDSLESLVEKSLVRRLSRDRFGMLQTIHDFASERLDTGRATALRQRHLEQLSALAERAERELRGQHQLRWLDLLEAEHDNIRAALGFALGGGEARTALLLLTRLRDFYDIRAHYSEARRWLTEALGAVPEGPERGDGLQCAALFAFRQGDNDECRRLGEASLRAHELDGDRAGSAFALANLTFERLFRGDLEAALRQGDEAVERARLADDEWVLSWALSNAGCAHLEAGQQKLDAGERQQGRRLVEEASAIARRLGDRRLIAITVGNLGEEALELRDLARAVPLLTEAMIALTGLRERAAAANIGRTLALVALYEGDVGEAERRLRTVAESDLEFGLQLSGETALVYAMSSTARGDDRPAVRRWAAATAALGERLTPFLLPGVERFLEPLRQKLPVDAFEADWAAGARTPVRAMLAELVSGEAR